MKRLEYVADKLKPFLQDIGETTDESAAQKVILENRIAEGLLPNSFQFTLELGEAPAIIRSFQTKRHLGVDKISYREYINLIHEEWWKIYVYLAVAGYRVSLKYADELMKVKACTQLKIPLRVNNEGKYIWYNQVTLPASYDKNGHLTAHINVYQMDRHYDMNFLMSAPLTVLGLDERPEIEKAVQKGAEQLFYDEFITNTKEKREKKLPTLTENQAKVLFLFRYLSQGDRQDKVTSESVAVVSKRFWPDDPLTQSAVSSHTRDIRKHFEKYAKEGTPLNNNNFGTFREMAAFLNSLFGPVEGYQANTK